LVKEVQLLGTAEPRLRLPQPLFVQPVKKMFYFIIEMVIEKINQNLEQKAKKHPALRSQNSESSTAFDKSPLI
jgi:hypothetical protein